jgi:hypothetical protein
MGVMIRYVITAAGADLMPFGNSPQFSHSFHTCRDLRAHVAAGKP